MAELLAANQITIAKVLDGEKGIPGEKGADGKSSYFHIKYSSVANPTSSSQMTETPSTYIGTYVDFTEADSTDPAKYTWSRFEGIQGEKGEQGIPGVGIDGKTSYLHIAYATSADGSEGFSISESANKTYIGQYTDFVSTDSTDYTKYAWTKIKGEMSAEQIAQLNQASEDASQAKSDASIANTTASVAKVSIDNLEIGGRNFVPNSGTYIGWSKNAAFEILDGGALGNKQIKCSGFASGARLFANINITKLFPDKEFFTDTTLTISAYVKCDSVLTSTNTSIFARFEKYDGSEQFKEVAAWIPIDTDISGWTKISASYKFPKGTFTSAFVRIALGDVVDIYVSSIKLETGSRATDWTPAPEDVDAGIKDAAKVATNFINYDSTNGLIVGNKTSGTWSGYRSQILPGSFNVLDASSTVLASFGPTTVIGEEAKANIHLTFNNLSMVDKDGTTLFEVGDNRNAEGIATIKHTAMVTVSNAGSATVTVNSNISSIISVYADSVQLSSSEYSFSGMDVTINGLTANSKKTIEITYTTTESTVYLTFGERDSSGNIGNYSVAEGYNVISSGYCSHAEGYRTNASAQASHAEGGYTTASEAYSHAEGQKTTASGWYSHAEGHYSKANEWASHAEGQNTTASGMYSHAEGENTIASAIGTHAGGRFTVADGNYMTAIGEYNTRNSHKAFVIGNGTSDKDRSNAFAVDWSGNTVMKGGLTLGTALSIANGGTGAANAAGALANLGIKDYVIENGTTSGWTYRKWASGKVQAWYNLSVTGTIDTASGNIYISDATQSIQVPASVMSSSDNVQARITSPGSYMCWLASCSGREPSSRQVGQFYLCRGSKDATSRTRTIEFYVEGKA